jgi:hypothetical protein
MLKLLKGFYVYLIQLLPTHHARTYHAWLVETTYPLMLQSLLSGQASFGLANKSTDKILGGIAHLEPLFTLKFKLPAEDSSQDFLIIVTIEWWVPAEQYVQNAAGRPHVTGVIVVP